MASYLFPEIELEDECEPELQFNDSSPILESILTSIVLPKLKNILELVLIPISELEQSFHPFTFFLLDKHKDLISLHPLEVAQNFKNHLDILASYPFLEIELMQESDPDP